MRIAILSDIHGNYDALTPVLADLDKSRVDRTVCLGDCIGYGPEPEAVIKEIRRRAIPTIIGNHELAVCDRVHLRWFNPLARESLEKTLTLLSDDSLAFIRQLPHSRVMPDYHLVHGYPPDSARTYLFQKSTLELQQTLSSMAPPICFIGHTHDLELVGWDGDHLDRQPLHEGIALLAPNRRYLVNVGSVGQPRDGNHHAKYVIWDQENGQLETRFIPYDIARTVAKIEAAGLPEAHARRLW
ncbi:MAG: metallophosphoesterase family protein [Desulfatitalea sp.]|nr:metallophosphoesterase family protein [Desulfatitalea sp.]